MAFPTTVDTASSQKTGPFSPINDIHCTLDRACDFADQFTILVDKLIGAVAKPPLSEVGKKLPQSGIIPGIHGRAMDLEEKMADAYTAMRRLEELLSSHL